MKTILTAAIFAASLLASASTFAGEQTVTLNVKGMTCASCALRIERVLGRQDGVESAVVNFAGQEARAVVDPGAVDIAGLQAAIEKLGYEITPFAEGEDRRSLTERYDEEVAFQERNLIGAAILSRRRITTGQMLEVSMRTLE